MKSLDSNILLSAANGDCAEYALAAAMLNDALSALHEWLPADQVLFELSSGRTQVMSDAQGRVRRVLTPPQACCGPRGSAARLPR